MRTAKLVLFIAAVVGLVQIVVASGSKVPSSSSSSDTARTPQEMARSSYNSGISHKDKAQKMETDGVTQTFKDAKEKDKFDAKVKDEYNKALKDFQNAAKQDPTLFQALNGLGFAYRKLGDPAKALENYDKALQMAPGFPDAVEYRGEAYLTMGRIDDAKSAYMSLFATDRKQADVLLRAMGAWQAKPTTNVDPAALTAFGSWIKERQKLASTTSDMALNDNRSIWK